MDKRNIIFYIVLIVDFYIIPWFMVDTGSAMFIMLAVIPAICFVTSVLYGIRNGFDFRYSLIAALLFVPSIYMFYNASAWIYTAAYAGIALLGNLAALSFRKSRFRYYGKFETERERINMKKFTFKQQIFVGVILIAAGNILAFILHKGWFANIAWILYGLIFILNPVYPERYSNDVKKAKLGARIAGIICILAGLLTKYVV